MKQQKEWPTDNAAAGLEAMIDQLAEAETGAPMQVRDYVYLLALGVATPALLLVWGWA